jgi:hypothetical protein
MGFMSLKDEKWVVNDRELFKCVRSGYDIVTVDKREYVGTMRWEKDAEYVVKIHNQ